MKKQNIYSPLPETIQYMVEGQQKYPYRLDLTNADYRECNEFDASQNARESLNPYASRSKFDASQCWLS